MPGYTTIWRLCAWVYYNMETVCLVYYNMETVCLGIWRLCMKPSRGGGDRSKVIFGDGGLDDKTLKARAEP